jgi:hypothetical protein
MRWGMTLRERNVNLAVAFFVIRCGLYRGSYGSWVVRGG